MRQVLLKIVVLGAIFCLSLFHRGTFADEEVAIPPTKDTAADEEAATPPEDTALSGIKFIGGAFVSNVRDEFYFSKEGKVTRGAPNHYPISLGFLAHVPLWSGLPFGRLKCSPALSGGFAGDFSTRNGQISAAGQVALGLSLLFDSDEHLFAITAGYTVRPVTRLSGYKVGDPFPDPGSSLTRSVYRRGFFLAVTSSFDFQNPFGSNEKKEPQQETGARSGGKPDQDGESQLEDVDPK